MENRNAIIKLVTKANNGYRNWERFRNRCMLVLEKGIDFEIGMDDGSVKMVEKKGLGQLFRQKKSRDSFKSMLYVIF